MLLPVKTTEKPSFSAKIAAIVLAIAIFFSGFVFFFNNLSANLDHDSIAYSLSIEKNVWSEIYHPHHLLYNYFKWVVYDELKTNGYEGRALLVGQVFNAVFGALGGMFIFLLIRYLSRSIFLGVLASAFLVFCNGYWYCSTFGGVRIMGTVFLILTFYLACLYVYNTTLKYWQEIIFVACIALTHLMAVMSHQTNIMFVPVIFTLLVFKKELFWKKMGLLSLYLALLLILVVFLYWYIGWKVYYLTTWDKYYSWLTSYTTVGMWGNFTNRSIELAQAGVRSLYVGLIDGSVDIPGTKFRNDSAYNLFLITVRLLAVMLVVFCVKIFKERKAVLAALGVWLVLYVPFFIWWEPENMEFWLPMLPVSIILASLPLAKLWNISGFKKINYVFRAVLGTLLLVVLFIFCGYNYNNYICPRVDPMFSGYNRALHALDEAKVKKDELLFIMGWDAMRINLDYYTSQEYISLKLLLYGDGGDKSKFYADIKKRIDEKSAQQKRIIIHRDVLVGRYFDPINARYKTLEKGEFISYFQDNFYLSPLTKDEDPYYYEAKSKKNR